jgi:hypothetical protein
MSSRFSKVIHLRSENDAAKAVCGRKLKSNEFAFTDADTFGGNGMECLRCMSTKQDA